MAYIIYKATSPSGKSYIGYSQFTLKKRVQLHFSEARKGTLRPFCNALRKYGKDMKWEIIATYDNEKFAKSEEIRFISELSPEYNCTKGGEGTAGLVRTSQRQLLIDKNGTIYSGYEEACVALSVNKSTLYSAVTNGYWCNGNYISKYEEGMQSAIAPKTSPKRQRKVLNITTNETFNSIKEAAEFFKVAPQRLYDVLVGKRKRTRGQEFKYLDEEVK